MGRHPVAIRYRRCRSIQHDNRRCCCCCRRYGCVVVTRRGGDGTVAAATAIACPLPILPPTSSPTSTGHHSPRTVTAPAAAALSSSAARLGWLGHDSGGVRVSAPFYLLPIIASPNAAFASWSPMFLFTNNTAARGKGKGAYRRLATSQQRHNTTPA